VYNYNLQVSIQSVGVCWCLQHRGPQRSVENIVSMAFVMTIVIISVLSIEVGIDARNSCFVFTSPPVRLAGGVMFSASPFVRSQKKR